MPKAILQGTLINCVKPAALDEDGILQAPEMEELYAGCLIEISQKGFDELLASDFLRPATETEAAGEAAAVAW